MVVSASRAGSRFTEPTSFVIRLTTRPKKTDLLISLPLDQFGVHSRWRLALQTPEELLTCHLTVNLKLVYYFGTSDRTLVKRIEASMMPVVFAGQPGRELDSLFHSRPPKGVAKSPLSPFLSIFSTKLRGKASTVTSLREYLIERDATIRGIECP